MKVKSLFAVEVECIHVPNARVCKQPQLEQVVSNGIGTNDLFQLLLGKPLREGGEKLWKVMEMNEAGIEEETSNGGDRQRDSLINRNKRASLLCKPEPQATWLFRHSRQFDVGGWLNFIECSSCLSILTFSLNIFFSKDGLVVYMILHRRHPNHNLLFLLAACFRGLGVLRVVTALIQVHCDPGNLVLVINTFKEEQVSG